MSRLALVYPLVVLLLASIHTLVPPRSGVLALTAIVAPYLYAPLLLVLPVAVRYRNRSVGTALLGCALMFILRFGSTLLSLPPGRTDADTDTALPSITAITWNARASNSQLRDITTILPWSDAGIVALQELTVAESEALAASASVSQHYPYQLLAPHPLQEQLESVEGMGLLSRYPILEHGTFNAPATLWARLDLGHGQHVTVINTTPARARMGFFTYNPDTRDAHIRKLRTLIDPLLQRGAPVLLAGDFNVTEREATYTTLTAGLQDAHMEVGHGFGHTWRPGLFMNQRLAFLRIDYLLSSPQVQPQQIAVDCTPHHSDHCLVRGQFALIQP